MINFYSIEFDCIVKLHQEDNFEQGFEIEHVELSSGYNGYNFQHVLDQEQLIKLIYEQLESSL